MFPALPRLGLRGGTRGQGARDSSCPGRGLPASFLREEPAIPPGSAPARSEGDGGASFLSETYGIRQEFGPPRFKKTNKGKIVREGPPRAAPAAALPSPLAPGAARAFGGGGTPGSRSHGWSPVGFPALGLYEQVIPGCRNRWNTPSPSHKKGAASVAAWGVGGDGEQESLGTSLCLRERVSSAQRPR